MKITCLHPSTRIGLMLAARMSARAGASFRAYLMDLCDAWRANR